MQIHRKKKQHKKLQIKGWWKLLSSSVRQSSLATHSIIPDLSHVLNYMK